ncbi:MAG: prepilin-type N-terminal cleavage/methylation domain-containing protein [Gemmatimonadaceae bacterium]|nr:prepilin-type N-terminal cleavage/methylation domain-containing protein [Gemmatimonadaceae bacterium]
MTPRRGFTLIETIIALTILSGLLLAMGMGTTNMQRSIGASNIRTRAFARADVQIGLARGWPTWSTLDLLAGASYNGTQDGLVTTTTVTTDTTNRRRLKRIAVTVTAVQAGALATPVRRTISVSAP